MPLREGVLERCEPALVNHEIGGMAPDPAPLSPARVIGMPDEAGATA